MNRHKTLLIVLAGSLVFAVAYAQTDVFKSLSALTGGSWQMKTAKGVMGERWKRTTTGELQSMGFKVTGTDTTILERVRIIKKDNDIYYVPTVKDQNAGKETYFKLVSSANSQFVFSNPEHDFPQRVVYHLISRDSLHAWVDGQYNGKFVKQDFYYKRINN